MNWPISGDLSAKLLRTAPSAIILIDRQGKIILANLQAERLFGYTEDELVDQPIEILIPQRFQKLHARQREQYTIAPSARVMGAGRDLYGRRKDGTEVSVEIGLNPVDQEYVLASIVDITERKRSEERFRMAVEAAPNAMIMVNQKGEIILANHQTETLFGYQRQELLGKTIEILIPERFRHAHVNSRQNFFVRPETRAMGAGRNLHGIRKDGTEVAIEIGLNPMETSEGQFVLASVIDITQRLRNEQLQAAQEAAVEDSRLKSQFLANMSHEIRTPMNGIIGMTEMLLGTTLSPLQMDYTETIKRSADSLLTIINGILDFSKIEAGRLEIDVVEFDLNEILRDIEMIFSMLSEKCGLRFIFSRPSFYATFRGDENRIRQVLNNLVSNALKFTERGEITVSVSVIEESKDSTKLHFTIKDTGVGISEQNLSKLFQVFSQADDSNTRKFGGTGLGLSIAKRLVELMGGEIGVDSKLSAGSTFWFDLTLENGQPIREGHRAKDRPTLPATPAGCGKAFRILVAEDHSINQKLIQAILEQLGHQVEIAVNGKEAIKFLERTNYDIVFMDCQMPELDGFETTKIIRDSSDEKLKKIPVIAMTASAIKGDRERCLAAGMNDYISKPISIARIKEILVQWTSNL